MSLNNSFLEKTQRFEFFSQVQLITYFLRHFFRKLKTDFGQKIRMWITLFRAGEKW